MSSLAISTIRTPLLAPLSAEDAPPTRIRHEIGEGVRLLWSHGFLRAIALYATLINFATSAVFLVLPLKLLTAGVSPVAIGSIETVVAVSGIVGSLAAPSIIKRVPTGLVSIGSGVVAALTILPIAFTDDVLTIGAILAVTIFLLPAGNASVSSYMVAVIPDRLQGRTQAALTFAGGGLMPFGTLLGGAMLSGFGGETAMLVGGLLVFVSIVPLLASREVRELPTPDQWTIEAWPGQGKR